MKIDLILRINLNSKMDLVSYNNNKNYQKKKELSFSQKTFDEYSYEFLFPKKVKIHKVEIKPKNEDTKEINIIVLSFIIALISYYINKMYI